MWSILALIVLHGHQIVTESHCQSPKMHGRPTVFYYIFSIFLFDFQLKHAKKRYNTIIINLVFFSNMLLTLVRGQDDLYKACQPD